MTTRTDPHLKSLPNPPRLRRTSPDHNGYEAPKVVAEGVRVAVRPDPRTVTVTGIQAGLTVRGLGRNEIPVADWLCACGHHERARGRQAVIELNARARVQPCPHTTPATSGRAAA
ncbi:hypothetical protein [Streptomyces sp. NRRL S-15]|uniref:hypothetical protein n=1 Tax=Streptomyces sp. NRRL S-15 TaxID=1463886 RepID=UPI000A7084C1|nr:hypothetical protein [Streptomyces sp. NRRL S-15]